jgi:hypothetical protein
MDASLTHVPNWVFLSFFVAWSVHVDVFPGFFASKRELVRAKSNDIAILLMYHEHIIVESATEQRYYVG